MLRIVHSLYVIKACKSGANISFMAINTYEWDYFGDTVGGHQPNTMPGNFICDSAIVVYLIHCQKCHEAQYAGERKEKWKCVNFKCYSSKELITLNTLLEVVPTWYSFHSWVDWSNADKVSCSRRKHIDAGIEPSTFVSKVDILSTTLLLLIIIINNNNK